MAAGLRKLSKINNVMEKSGHLNLWSQDYPSQPPWGERKPIVLALTLDENLLRKARLIQPLEALLRMGWIGGYSILWHRDFIEHQHHTHYDIIWIQREGSVHNPLLEYLTQVPFLFDIDDLLLSRPGFVRIPFERQREMKDFIRRCSVLSACNSRLAKSLYKRVGEDLENKTIITPNGFDFPPEARRCGETPRAVVWTSSDFSSLEASGPEIIPALRDFCEERKLPLWIIGAFHEKMARELPMARPLGTLDFWQHKNFLASFDRLLPVSPLETVSDDESLEFIQSKSDIKMVEYGGNGQCGVYSDALPFTDTDLKTGVIAANDRAAWAEALREAAGRSALECAAEAEAIRRKRHMLKLATSCWAEALNGALLPDPVTRLKIEEILNPWVRRQFSGAVHSATSEEEEIERKKEFERRFFKPLLSRIEAKLSGQAGGELPSSPQGVLLNWDTPMVEEPFLTKSLLHLSGWYLPLLEGGDESKMLRRERLLISIDGVTHIPSPRMREDLASGFPDRKDTLWAGFFLPVELSPGWHRIELLIEQEDGSKKAVAARDVCYLPEEQQVEGAPSRKALINTLQELLEASKELKNQIPALPFVQREIVNGALDFPESGVHSETGRRIFIAGWALLPDGSYPQEVWIESNQGTFNLPAVEARSDVARGLGLPETIPPFCFISSLPSTRGLNFFHAKVKTPGGDVFSLGVRVKWNAGWDPYLDESRDKAYLSYLKSMEEVSAESPLAKAPAGEFEVNFARPTVYLLFNSDDEWETTFLWERTVGSLLRSSLKPKRVICSSECCAFFEKHPMTPTLKKEGLILESYDNGDPEENNSDELAFLVVEGFSFKRDAITGVLGAASEWPEASAFYGDVDHSGDPSGKPIHPIFLPSFSEYNLRKGLGPAGCLAIRLELVRAYIGRKDRLGGLDGNDTILELLGEACKEFGEETIHHLPTMMGTLVETPQKTPFHRRALHRFHSMRAAVEERLHVSILIPTRNRPDLVEQVVRGIRTMTLYPSFDILLLDNQSDDPKALRKFNDWESFGWFKRISCPGPFNFSAINNRGAQAAKGELILFLNNDIEIREKDWLQNLVRPLIEDPSVGAVGGRLLYPDGRIQHGGIFTGVGGIAVEAFRHLAPGEPGIDGRPLLEQEFSAVTGACLLTRRHLFLDQGGFNVRDLAVAYNDVDYCLRLREIGYRVVWTPHATLVHHESQTRGLELSAEKKARLERESQYMLERWATAIDADPFYHPLCNRKSGDFYPPSAELGA